MSNGFEIRGVTPDFCLPECEPEIFKQLCETDILTIEACDPDIKELVYVDVTILLRNFKIIRSAVGRKIIIYAVKNIKVVFRSGRINYHTDYCIPYLNCSETYHDYNCTEKCHDCEANSIRCDIKIKSPMNC